jgi:D-3-phosphoglycerate dehydrogenase
MYKVLFAGSVHPSGLDILDNSGLIERLGPYTQQRDFLAQLPLADALIVQSQMVVDWELLRRAERLKVLIRAGARLDHIDIEGATRLGILVGHVPDTFVTSIAEHTFALLLSLARHLPQNLAGWQKAEPLQPILGFELAGKTLGLVGFGNIARQVARRALAFGMHVHTYDPYIPPDSARSEGVRLVSLAELLANSDILSLHATYRTREDCIVNADTLSKVKVGCYLINAADARLIDEAALERALANGKIAGVALDGVQNTQANQDHSLCRFPQVILSPNLNQSTIEAQTRTSIAVAQQCLQALTAKDYINFVNLPFTAEVTYAKFRPYLELAEKMGKVQGYLAEQNWITQLEVEVHGEGLQNLVRPIATALLKGMLRPLGDRVINYANAPLIASEQGIQTKQSVGLPSVNYPNMISCRVHWTGGSQTLSGVLFADGEARIVQYSNIAVDVRPKGYILILENQDVPGVIGKVGTLLGKHQVNIGEWRYGRDYSGGKAISFINLDSYCPSKVLQLLQAEPEIYSAKLLKL